MSHKANKIKLPFPVIVLGLVVGFGYGGFVLLGKIDAEGASYQERSKELIALEKKQEHIAQLELELAGTAEGRGEITSALLASGDALDFIVGIENIARKAGLTYEVRILKETTQESIDAELSALRRARRQSREAIEESVEQRLPGITFNVAIEGPYSGIIRFMEGVASLPYYVRIENFAISSKKKTGDAESPGAEKPAVTATVQMTVFTR